MDKQRKECVVAPVAIFGSVLVALAGCASNPPPRPMPQPVTQSSQGLQTRQTQQTAENPERQTAGQTAANPAPALEAPTQTAEPDWYRQGPFEVDGREHRAFAVTAGDVREARSQAMLLAYEAYPKGAVAAHEAVRQADGSWRFYVLMARGG
jgi:hypothetical protein